MACEKIVGYSSVYRIQFTLACFFFVMMILMLCVKRSKDPRSAIQNGYEQKQKMSPPMKVFRWFRFWFFKILILIGIGVGAFFIPNQGFATSN